MATPVALPRSWDSRHRRRQKPPARSRPHVLRAIKLLLLVGGLGSLATVMLWDRGRPPEVTEEPGVSVSTPSHVMSGARLVGTDIEGRHYTVTAEQVFEETDETHAVHLDDLHARFFSGETEVSLTAAAGRYDAPTRRMTMSGGVRMDTRAGTVLETESAEYFSEPRPRRRDRARARRGAVGSDPGRRIPIRNHDRHPEVHRSAATPVEPGGQVLTMLARLALVAVTVFAAAAFTAADGTAVRAQETALDLGPTEITADSLEWNDAAATATAEGNAVARQTGRTLRAGRFVAYAVRGEDGSVGGIGLIEASGGVEYATAAETARGDQGRYDITGGVITLTGNVELERDGSVLRGETLTIDLTAGTSRVTGGEGNRPIIEFSNSTDQEESQ